MTTVCSYPTTTTGHHYGYMAYSFSRDSNNAGMALPHIPRRTSSQASSHPRTPPIQPASPPRRALQILRSPPAPVANIVVQPPTPPDAIQSPKPIQALRALHQPVASSSSLVHSDLSSGSGSEGPIEILVPKQRRNRVQPRAVLLRPPEHSTPTPAMLMSKAEATLPQVRIPFPASFTGDDTPRTSSSTIHAPRPRPGISPLARNNDASLPPRSVSVSIAQIGRKKSGEPLKSSLKSRSAVVRGDLSVITGTTITKSEPTTPTCGSKSVHFDSQLEDVKLFWAEQKPLAVSRDGSPTDDTSGTESDFPAFIYGDRSSGIVEEQGKKGKLEMVVQGLKEVDDKDKSANVGRKQKVDADQVEVKLESVQLCEDGMSVAGRVRVKNIAFEKWVAVRFTCDWWQTTSEVTARYLESSPSGSHDVFQFTIRLNDLSRIEEKTMFLAVRYSAAGREIWDNNAGENYKITFKRQAVDAEPAGRATGIADLKSKLEKVALDGEMRASTVGGFLASHRSPSSSPSPSPSPHGHARSASLPNTASPSDRRVSGTTNKSGDAEDDDSFTLKSNTPLSSRYDFAASLKSPWRRSPPQFAFRSASDATPADIRTPTDRARTRTYPTAFPQFPRRGGVTDKRALIELTRGSPRIFDAEEHSPPSSVLGADDLEETPVPPTITRKGGSGSGSGMRNHQRGYFDLGVKLEGGGNVKRTPPGSPFGVPGGVAGVGVGVGDAAFARALAGAQKLVRVPSGGSEESTPSSASNDESSNGSSPPGSPRSPGPGDQSSYNVFLDRFCFYTGPDSMVLDTSPELHRSHSASSVEEFLSTSPYLGNDYLSAGRTPTRSSSYDDVPSVGASEASTPTLGSVNRAGLAMMSSSGSSSPFEIAAGRVEGYVH